jgi:hypothetical protein
MSKRRPGKYSPTLQAYWKMRAHLLITAILKDRSLFSDFNEAYAEFFPENPPTRTPIFSDTGASLVLIDVIAGME